MKVLHIPADVAAPRLQRASCQQAGEGEAENTASPEEQITSFFFPEFTARVTRQPRPAGKLRRAGNILLDQDVNYYYLKHVQKYAKYRPNLPESSSLTLPHGADEDSRSAQQPALEDPAPVFLNPVPTGSQ